MFVKYNLDLMTISNEMLHLMNLESVTQVTMPRAGSEYLQSLFDGNEEVLIFPTNFRFFSEYLPNSLTLNYKKKFAEDIIIEFIGKEFHRFKTRYFIGDDLYKLGKTGKETIDIPIIDYINNFKNLVKNVELNPKNIFLGIYGAFHKTIGRDIFSLKIIWHHSHLYNEAIEFQRNFNNSKLIINIRNPLAVFYAIQKSYKIKDHNNYRYLMLEGTIKNIGNYAIETNILRIRKIFKDIIFVKLEDLPKVSEIKRIASFLNVGFDANNFISTWASYEWFGDMASARKYEPDEKWSKKRSYNGWNEGLTYREKYIIRSIFGDFMKDQNYIEVYYKKNFWELIKFFFYLILPIKTEIDFFSSNYYRKKFLQYKKINFMLVIAYFINEFFLIFKFRYVLLNLYLNSLKKTI